MIVFAILGFLAAIVWSFFVIMANGMSDAPMSGFQGGGMILAAWIVEAVLILAWWFK